MRLHKSKEFALPERCKNENDALLMDIMLRMQVCLDELDSLSCALPAIHLCHAIDQLRKDLSIAVGDLSPLHAVH